MDTSIPYIIALLVILIVGIIFVILCRTVWSSMDHRIFGKHYVDPKTIQVMYNDWKYYEGNCKYCGKRIFKRSGFTGWVG